MATSSTPNVPATITESAALPTTTRRSSGIERSAAFRSVARGKKLFDEGLELLRVERLLEEAVRSCIVRGDVVAVGRERRDDDDRRVAQLGISAEMLENGEPASAWHHHVEEDEVGTDGVDQCDRLGASAASANA